MSDDIQPLSDDERAELEALRAEKAAREERERAVRGRAELEELRRQRDAAASQAQAQRQAPSRQAAASARAAEAAEDRHIREARERGARLMEPDEDLRMPVGQKLVLGVIALLVAIIVIMHFFVG